MASGVRHDGPLPRLKESTAHPSEMVERKWRVIRAPDGDQEYVVMASFLPLKRFTKSFRFLRYASAVGRQLEGTRGVIGFSLRASILKKRFWTLSAWENTERLMEFVRTAPHADVMAAMRNHMRPTKFLQWRVAGSDLPPSSDDALRRLQTP